MAGLLPNGTLKVRHTGYKVVLPGSTVTLEGYGLGLLMYINQSSSSRMGVSFLHSYGVFEDIIKSSNFSTSVAGEDLVLSSSDDSSTITVKNNSGEAKGFHICWIGLKI